MAGSIGLAGDCSYYVLIEWVAKRQATAKPRGQRVFESGGGSGAVLGGEPVAGGDFLPPVSPTSANAAILGSRDDAVGRTRGLRACPSHSIQDTSPNRF